MAITERKRLFGLIREINLTPEQVEKLQRDVITQKYHPDILDGRINEDGSATIRSHFLDEDIVFILDADVEGQVFT